MEKLSNFRKVWEFHDSFELDINEEYNNKILENEKLVKLRIDLIKEELNELFEAFTNYDFVEVRDAIGDIIYVVNGMGVSFGIDIDKNFRSMYDRSEEFNKLSLFGIVKEINKKIDTWVNDNNPEMIYELFEGKGINNNSYIRYMKHLLDINYNNLCKYISSKNKKEIEINTNSFLLNILSLGHYLCIDVDNDFDLIHKSNMSKLCVSEDEAIKTVENYKEKFENGKSPYDTPAYKLSKNGKYYIVYNQSTNKILKSINYEAVKLLYKYII